MAAIGFSFGPSARGNIMYIVYVLKSLYSPHIYVGQTSNQKRRLRAHELGKQWFTNLHKPTFGYLTYIIEPLKLLCCTVYLFGELVG